MWETDISSSLAQESDRSAKGDQPARKGARTVDHSAIQISCKNIMLTCDGSPFAEKAFQVARTIAQELGARLLIIGVAPLPPNPGIADLEHTIDQAHERFSRRFYKIRLDGMNEGLQIETMLALGDAGELTWRNAERFRVHLIVGGCPSLTPASGSNTRAEEVPLFHVGSNSRAGSKKEEVCVPLPTNQEIE